MTTIYVASVVTRHFNFDAAGATAEEATAALRVVMEAHGRQYRGRVAFDWPDAEMEEVEIREMVLGVGYRDREEVTVNGR